CARVWCRAPEAWTRSPRSRGACWPSGAWCSSSTTEPSCW
ncbi:hypothetical protein CRUP_013250, partial [Coryphaenoides rupestris]